MQVELATVVKNEKLAKNTFKITVKANLVKEMNTPGQFVNIKIPKTEEFLLRRPISICEINKEKNNFVMIYKTVGEGTKIISQLKAKEKIDILAPLGNGYNMDSLKKGQTALLIGGGIGVPPLYELAKQFKQKGIKTIHILGFNTKEEVFYEENFKKIGKTYIATADGSYGEKGYVTDIIKQKNIKYDKYYSCGPILMLKEIKKLENKKQGYLSLEERMACGVGACYGCICKTKSSSTKRVCYDGPVFKAEEIAF